MKLVSECVRIKNVCCWCRCFCVLLLEILSYAVFSQDEYGDHLIMIVFFADLFRWYISIRILRQLLPIFGLLQPNQPPAPTPTRTRRRWMGLMTMTTKVNNSLKMVAISTTGIVSPSSSSGRTQEPHLSIDTLSPSSTPDIPR